MDLRHEFTVPIGVDEAWRAFNDLAGIAPCFPGAVITSVEGDDFTGNAKVKLGPISLQYAGSGRFVTRDESSYHAVIEASGKDKRGNGTAAATITARLEDLGAETKVVVDTELKITGRPAQFGRGVIQDVGSRILDQFAACLSSTLGQPAGDAADESAGPPPVEEPVAGAVARDALVDDAVEGAAAGVAPTAQASQSSGAPAQAVPPRAASRPPAPRPAEPAELDLGGVVGPVLLKRYGATALACAVTAVLTWLVARRRR